MKNGPGKELKIKGRPIKHNCLDNWKTVNTSRRLVEHLLTKNVYIHKTVNSIPRKKGWSFICRTKRSLWPYHTPLQQSFGYIHVGITFFSFFVCPSVCLSVQSCPVQIFLIEEHWKFLFCNRIAYDLEVVS